MKLREFIPSLVVLLAIAGGAKAQTLASTLSTTRSRLS